MPRERDPSAGDGPTTSAASRRLPFALVLGGGGARGFAHVGVLRALEHRGLAPSALVGVSMGAAVAATYALNPDWYSALLRTRLGPLRGPLPYAGREPDDRPGFLRRAWESARGAWRTATGWGSAAASADSVLRALVSLTLGRDLTEGRVPVAVCATDLVTGERVPLASGDAADAVYASSALAGVLPPHERDGRLLVDGAYADLAPIDVGRAFGFPVVIAVDPGQDRFTGEVRSGFQALVRALEICHRQHATLRFADADVLIRPAFRRAIDVLAFDARRECVAAGVRAVRAERVALDGLVAASGAAEHRPRPGPGAHPGAV